MTDSNKENDPFENMVMDSKEKGKF